MKDERIVVAPTARSRGERAGILQRARELGFVQYLGFAAERPSNVARARWWERRGERIVPPRGLSPRSGIAVREIGSAEELRRWLRRSPNDTPIAIRWTADRVIPLENLVASRRRVWVVTARPTEVPAALGALEKGAEAVVFEVGRTGAVDALARSLAEARSERLPLTSLPLLQWEPSGTSERLLIDTTSWLGADEGLLVGSRAATLFLVASEAVGSPHSAPRPFRVNAGAPHSYVLTPDGTTRYLSELRSGAELLAVRSDGSTRPVVVGRVKVERRPMVRLDFRDGDVAASLFVQEAETVRLLGPRRSFSVVSLKRGFRAWAARLPPARHLGEPVEESIVER